MITQNNPGDIHEFKIYTSQTTFLIDIIMTEDRSFAASISGKDRSSNVKPKTTAKKAFEHCINLINTVLVEQNDYITAVDNRCNTPFITKNDQIQILGQNIKVTVNGQ